MSVAEPAEVPAEPVAGSWGEVETAVRAQLAAERVDTVRNANAAAAIFLARKGDAGVDFVNALREMRFHLDKALRKGAPIQGGTLTKIRGGAETSRRAAGGRRTRSA